MNDLLSRLFGGNELVGSLVGSAITGAIKAGLDAVARRDLDDAQKEAHFWQRLDEERAATHADRARIDAATAAAAEVDAEIRRRHGEQDA